MALVDPNIAMGYRGVEIPNQLAQYSQLSAIQNAQNQNALAQYQLSAAQRADEQQTNLYAAAKQPDFKLDFQTAIQYGAPGIAAFKAQQESSKTQGEINAQERKAALDRADAFSTALAPLVASVHEKKPITHQDVFAQANRLVAQGLLRKEDLGAIPMNAAELPKFVMNMATSTENSRKALQAYMPEALVAGGNIVNKNPLAAGGIGNVLGDVSLTKFEAGRLPILQQQANIAGGQLNLAQAKFDFEKANPTMSIQEDPSGLLAVNTRTGVATPIVYGPTGFQAAPAAAPGASMMRQPPAALPGQRTPAIPGMTSVLDQTAAPAAPVTMPLPSATGERVPGQPVSGKGKPPPEAYAKQALGVANTNDALEKMQDTMKNFKSSDMLNPTRRAELGQAHAATLLFAKELFNLGVLNGGDERIINSVINNPIDFSSTAVPIEAIKKQARDLQGVVDRTNKNLSTIYKMPLLKLERSAPSGGANDIHSQAEAIIRGTP
jgi:hypothetical protein